MATSNLKHIYRLCHVGPATCLSGSLQIEAPMLGHFVKIYCYYILIFSKSGDKCLPLPGASRYSRHSYTTTSSSLWHSLGPATGPSMQTQASITCNPAGPRVSQTPGPPLCIGAAFERSCWAEKLMECLMARTDGALLGLA